MSPRSSSQTLKLTYHSIGPNPWSLIRSTAVSAGSASTISPTPRSSLRQNSTYPSRTADRSRPLRRAMGRVPGVPELVLDPVRRHQVVQEQVPAAPACRNGRP